MPPDSPQTMLMLMIIQLGNKSKGMVRDYSKHFCCANIFLIITNDSRASQLRTAFLVEKCCPSMRRQSLRIKPQQRKSHCCGLCLFILYSNKKRGVHHHKNRAAVMPVTGLRIPSADSTTAVRFMISEAIILTCTFLMTLCISPKRYGRRFISSLTRTASAASTAISDPMPP